MLKNHQEIDLDINLGEDFGFKIDGDKGGYARVRVRVRSPAST